MPAARTHPPSAEPPAVWQPGRVTASRRPTRDRARRQRDSEGTGLASGRTCRRGRPPVSGRLQPGPPDCLTWRPAGDAHGSSSGPGSCPGSAWSRQSGTATRRARGRHPRTGGASSCESAQVRRSRSPSPALRAAVNRAVREVRGVTGRTKRSSGSSGESRWSSRGRDLLMAAEQASAIGGAGCAAELG